MKTHEKRVVNTVLVAVVIRVVNTVLVAVVIRSCPWSECMDQAFMTSRLAYKIITSFICGPGGPSGLSGPGWSWWSK